MDYQRGAVTLRKSVQSASEATGERFWDSLGDVFSPRLGLDCFLVGRCTADSKHFRTVSLSIDNTMFDAGKMPAFDLPFVEDTQTDEPFFLTGIAPLLAQAPPPLNTGRFDACTGLPLFDSKGNHIGVMAAFSRATLKKPRTVATVLKFFAARVGTELERLGREDDLRKQIRFSQNVLDAVPTPIFFKDENGIYIGCNRAFEEALGVSRETLPGRTVYDIAPKDLATIYHQADEELFRQGGVQTYETSVLFADGKRREVLFNRTVFAKNDGSLGGLVGTMFDITERKEAERAARYLAHFDPLTKLPNQVLFTDRLSLEIAASHRLKRRFALICLDLDHFKKINTVFGHDRGDHVLQRFAKRLGSFLREGDTVSRMGGDSFNLLLPDVGQESDLARIVERILKIVSQPYLVDGMEITVTASLGLSVYPDDGSDAQTLLKHADTALQQAKEHGRNTLRFYAPEMNARARERMLTENLLRKALGKDEFVLHYQPQVDAESLQVIGVEALLRWQHPERGLLTPQHFIELAEETSLILPIGEWVLRTACAQARAWQASGLAPLRIGVNLSPRQFQQPYLFESIEKILAEERLPPQQLSLEITESVLMKDTDHAIQTLHRLKRLGVHLSVDDFGTGYSSLSYLKNLPIDMLKIDRSFVMDIPSLADDMTIVSAVISMAHKLNIKVLAEGVQNHEQRLFLQSCRCDELQGYLFSRPLEAEKIMHLDIGAPSAGRRRTSSEHPILSHLPPKGVPHVDEIRGRHR